MHLLSISTPGRPKSEGEQQRASASPVGRSEGATSNPNAVNPRPSKNSGAPNTAENHLAALDRAQQHLSRLLLADIRDMPAIIEAAEQVRRAESRVVAIERGAPR